MPGRATELVPMNRRHFLKASGLTGSSLLFPVTPSTRAQTPSPVIRAAPAPAAPAVALPNLEPARWIWLPSGRTLQNTFVLFRRTLPLRSPPRRATGWIAAESRYRLEVNGRRLQWGPAPSDPRWPEADPVDLTHALQSGDNVIGATVLYYGVGDGTWPLGKPGFLFWLELEYADGAVEKVVSDESWSCSLCRAWPPGQYKRWYLRALQEQFDARHYPHGWTHPSYTPDHRWRPAMPLQGSPNKPALSTSYYEYQLDLGTGPADTELRPRSIPLMQESEVTARRPVEAFRFTWRIPPEDYFDFRPPDAFVATPESVPDASGTGWVIGPTAADEGRALTFEFAEQIVGWPKLVVDAPAGTIIELLVHEAHQVGGPPLLNTHFDSWTRFICREGRNEFETFDFESFRWLQLHVRNAHRPVRIAQVGARRRVYPWPHLPALSSSEPALQRLFDACVNTLNNSAQETLVDGMARERQQYSGDGGHQLHAVHLAFGAAPLVARYVTTFSQGMTKDGFFLDCWPAWDRLARLIERQLDLSGWGPILDHGVGFNFDCWSHYLYTGDRSALREAYPRLVRFAQYLRTLVTPSGLLPVEELGIPSVWIDHVAYQRQRHKQCAFNLYAAAALRLALAPMCRAFGDPDNATAIATFGRSLQDAAVAHFWDPRRALFINNLPWAEEEGGVRTCDRSLATAILFDQCPGGNTAAAERSLVECPPEMGFSYPCNAGWRLWALGATGHVDPILEDFRKRWATMTSVLENNTLQEDWDARHDSGQQWSHCAVVPLYVAYHCLLGLRPLAPGFERYELRPQLGNLERFAITANTVRGPITLAAEGSKGARRLRLQLPPNAAGELVLPEAEQVELPALTGPRPKGTQRLALPQNSTVELKLRHI